MRTDKTGKEILAEIEKDREELRLAIDKFAMKYSDCIAGIFLEKRDGCPWQLHGVLLNAELFDRPTMLYS